MMPRWLSLGWAMTAAFALFVVGMVGAVEFGWIARAVGFVIVLLGTAVYIPVLRANTDGDRLWRSRADRV